MSNTDAPFLSRLQSEAKLQSKLHRERWLPAQLDPLTTFIGQYSWQVLLVMALITSVLVEVFT